MAKRVVAAAKNAASRPTTTASTSPPVASSSIQYFSDAARAETQLRAVAKWFEAHQRPLPWRPLDGKRRDAYGTWVCEVMSQQTRIQTVMEYWKRWMVTFPTVSSLAAADPEQVRALWTGLGFYRRAGLLHKGAQYLMEHHGGKLPGSAAELRKVPGIGPYTAGAIASICFEELTPAVDGNVVRVLSRLCGEKHFDPKDPKSIKMAWTWAESMFSSAATKAGGLQAGSVTEGMIELGATLCGPSGAPNCSACPLANSCTANRLLGAGDIEAIDGVIPCRGSKAKVRLEECVSIVHTSTSAPVAAKKGRGSVAVEPSSLWLLVQRPSTGLLANLFEFPNITLSSSLSEEVSMGSESDEEAAAPTTAAAVPAVVASVQKHLHSGKARDVSPSEYVGSYVHKFSHIHLTVHVVAVVHPNVSSLKSLLTDQNALFAPHAVEGGVVVSSSLKDAARQLVTLEGMQGLGVAKTVFKTIELITKASLPREKRAPSKANVSKRSRSSSS